MTILTIRTDKPDAEIGLYSEHTQIAYEVWTAHRQLAETLNARIAKILEGNSLTPKDIDGIICYAGPGSFTGLRIGMSVGNALAYALEIPIVSASGDSWIDQGASRLIAGEPDPVALPFYGAEANITQPKR